MTCVAVISTLTDGGAGQPATSLGGVESLLERRRRWPLESATVPESLLRLSVGIGDVEDLWADLDAALRSAIGR